MRIILAIGIAKTAPVAPATLMPIKRERITITGFMLNALPIIFGPMALKINC